MYLSFVNECLVNGKVDLFNPTKKVDVDIRLKEAKKIGKQFQIENWQEDRQVFDVMLGGRSKPGKMCFRTLLDQCS